MAIQYRVVSKRPAGIAGENQPKYYPILTNREVVDLSTICEIISSRSTFSGADIVGVIQSLIELVPELLMEGKNIQLDNLGIFSVHASGSGKETKHEVSEKDIKGLKLSFLPNKKIKSKLKHVTFKKVD